MLRAKAFLTNTTSKWIAVTIFGAGHYTLASQSFFHARTAAASVVTGVPRHALSTTVIDSAPVITMTVVKQLAAARRAIDSTAQTDPLASSRIPIWAIPRSVDGKIALLIADINSRPARVAAVTRSGFPHTRAYARALVWLNTAWALVVAERTTAGQGTVGAPQPTSVPGMSGDLVTFVREHETEITALGFPTPQALVATDGTMHDRLTATSHRRQFFDSTAHTIQIVTSAESDFLQGFIDSADATAPGTAARAPLRVLFLGNSLTYYHEMPRLFAHLAAAGLHRRVVAGLVSLPGSSLPQLWTQTDLSDVVRHMPWDVVVMQVRPAGLSDTSTNSYARMVADPVIAHHGRVFAWGQYGGPGEDPSFQAALDGIVSSAADAAHAHVAPISVIWDAVRQADTVVWKKLFYDLPNGDTHPSPLGSYLLALSFYRSMTGQSPVGLPRTFGDFAVSRAEAEQLQRIVASVRP